MIHLVEVLIWKYTSACSESLRQTDLNVSSTCFLWRVTESLLRNVLSFLFKRSSSFTLAQRKKLTLHELLELFAMTGHVL